MITGYSRHGKGTLASGFLEAGWKCKDSSYASAEIFLFDALKGELGYRTVQECWQDRHNHRARWYEMISGYNASDNCRLMRGIYEHNDVYVGIRSRQELLTGLDQRLVDLVIWVERPSYAAESHQSMNIRKGDSDIVVYNTGEVGDLRRKGHRLARLLDGDHK